MPTFEFCPHSCFPKYARRDCAASAQAQLGLGLILERVSGGLGRKSTKTMRKCQEGLRNSSWERIMMILGFSGLHGHAYSVGRTLIRFPLDRRQVLPLNQKSIDSDF